MNWFLITFLIIVSALGLWAIVWGVKANLKTVAELDQRHQKPPVIPDD
jgi:hypothetical protein